MNKKTNNTPFFSRFFSLFFIKLFFMFLLVWILIAYGMSNILVYGSIFERPRIWIIANSKFFGEMLQCMMCTSVWVGFFLSLFLASPSSTYFDLYFLPSIFFDGVLASGAVWALNSIIEFFEK